MYNTVDGTQVRRWRNHPTRTVAQPGIYGVCTYSMYVKVTPPCPPVTTPVDSPKPPILLCISNLCMTWRGELGERPGSCRSAREREREGLQLRGRHTDRPTDRNTELADDSHTGKRARGLRVFRVSFISTHCISYHCTTVRRARTSRRGWE